MGRIHMQYGGASQGMSMKISIFVIVGLGGAMRCSEVKLFFSVSCSSLSWLHVAFRRTSSDVNKDLAKGNGLAQHN